jgi:hypothetical protein
MRMTLGVLLITAGLVGGYLILSGKFPPQAAAPSGSGKSGTGSGAQSLPSMLHLSSLGHPVAPVHVGDRHASRGGYR